MKLTAKAVAALDLPSSKTDAIFFDDSMAGFGYRLRRGAGGKLLRSWICQYRRAGASRRLLLGSAEVLGVEQARALAKKALGRVAGGEDPQADRIDRRGKDRVKLSSMIDEYLLQKQTEVRPRTMESIKLYLTGDYFRPLHTMAIDKITRGDIAARLVVITREHKGSISAARARATLSAFFVWAMQNGLVEANPVIGTKKPNDAKPRERVLSNEELAAIWRACGDDDYGRIIKLLILLGSRRGEIGGIAHSEIDLEKAQWTLPASRSKNDRAHTLPLMPMALAIIQQIPHMVSRDQLFGERANRGFTAWGENKSALDARAGVTDPPYVIHDIRRTVATRMADIGIGPHIIEAVLNHYSGHRAGPAGVYNRSNYPNEVRAALAQWEDHVRTLVEGGERKVVPITQPAAG